MHTNIFLTIYIYDHSFWLSRSHHTDRDRVRIPWPLSQPVKLYWQRQSGGDYDFCLTRSNYTVRDRAGRLRLLSHPVKLYCQRQSGETTTSVSPGQIILSETERGDYDFCLTRSNYTVRDRAGRLRLLSHPVKLYCQRQSGETTTSVSPGQIILSETERGDYDFCLTRSNYTVRDRAGRLRLLSHPVKLYCQRQSGETTTSVSPGQIILSETERGDYDFCLTRSNYTVSFQVSREYSAGSDRIHDFLTGSRALYRLNNLPTYKPGNAGEIS